MIQKYQIPPYPQKPLILKHEPDFQLMIMGKVVATRTEFIGQETVHGQAVNRELQAVFLTRDVADSDFYLQVAAPIKSQ